MPGRLFGKGNRHCRAGGRITHAPTHRARSLSHGLAYAPDDDAPGVNIDDERHIQPALSGREIGEVRVPELVWPIRAEPPIDSTQPTHGSIVGESGAQPLGTPHALQAPGAHQAFDRATGNHHSFAAQLPSDLVGTIDAMFLMPDPITCTFRCASRRAQSPRRDGSRRHAAWRR